MGDKSTPTECRNENINRTCNNIAQHIVQAFKSKIQVTYKPKSSTVTFRNTTETPLTVGLSLHCYHSTRSEKLLDLLSHAGTGISYKQTMNNVNKIACAVHENISSNDGVYVPLCLLKYQPLRTAIDNIDAKVDTPDGKKLLPRTCWFGIPGKS